MATAIQFLRSPVANLRPDPNTLFDGMPMISTHEGSPGLYFRLRDSSLCKIGPVQVSPTQPNSTPAGYAGNTIGEMWLDTSGSTQTLKVFDGSTFVTTGGGGGGAGNPAGPSLSIQFNNGNVFGGESDFTFNPSTNGVVLNGTSQANDFLAANQGSMILRDNSSGNQVAWRAPASVDASYTLTMPAALGQSNTTLINDGNGNLSWGVTSGGGGGTKGSKGEPGFKGQKGTKGTEGAAGAAGSKGEKGIAGTNGTNGAKGDKGTTGTQGIKGASGTNGAKGATGGKGDKGTKGEASGLFDFKGTVAVIGDLPTTGNTPGDVYRVTGSNALYAWNGSAWVELNDVTAVKGQKGQQGESVKGNKGNDGASTTGAKGETGQKGTKGGKGEAGTNGTNGTKGEKGIDGSDGSNGAKGDKGAQGVGEKGTDGGKGQKGQDGTAGAKGTKGTAASAFVFKGSVADQNSLPPTGNTTGDIYVTADNSNLYAWDGTQWVLLGAVAPVKGQKGGKGQKGQAATKGEKGEKGTDGTKGVKGTDGLKGTTGTGSKGTKGDTGQKGQDGTKGLKGDATAASAVGTTGQVQYTDGSGNFQADADLVFDGTTLTAGAIASTGTLTVGTDKLTVSSVNGNSTFAGAVTATSFTGDGSGLTNLNISGTLIFKGSVDLTTDDPPGSPNAGDYYINTVGGVVKSTWAAPIAGTTVSANQLVYYTTTSVWVMGAIQDVSSFVDISSTQTITGSKTFTAAIDAQAGLSASGQTLSAAILALTGKGSSASTASGDGGTTLATKDYVDAGDAGGGTTSNDLTFGTHLLPAGGTFDGAAAVTVSVDATTAATADKIVLRDANADIAVNDLACANIVSTGTTITASSATAITAGSAVITCDTITPNTYSFANLTALP